MRGELFAFLGTVLLATVSAAIAAERPESEHGFKLLSDAGAQVLQLRNDALMVAYGATHSNVNWVGRVNEVKEHIQSAARQAGKLREERASVSPRQMATIDMVGPLLTELVRNSEIVIRYVEEGPNRLHERKAEIAARADLSSALASLITNAVQYGNAKQRLHSLVDEPDSPRR
jgi:hypothetical protein